MEYTHLGYFLCLLAQGILLGQGILLEQGKFLPEQEGRPTLPLYCIGPSVGHIQMFAISDILKDVYFSLNGPLQFH